MRSAAPHLQDEPMKMRRHRVAVCLGTFVSLYGSSTGSLEGLYTLSAPDGQLNRVGHRVSTALHG